MKHTWTHAWTFFLQKKVLIMWLYKDLMLEAKYGLVFDHLFYQQNCNTALFVSSSQKTIPSSNAILKGGNKMQHKEAAH